MSEALLPRVAVGDRDAVEACLERYGNLVWSLARRLTSNRTDAEDAVQEIFIDLWTHAARFDPDKASETTFVAMVARRRLIDRLRRSGREPSMEEIEAADQVAPVDAAADLIHRDEAARARKLIEALRPEQRRVIKLSVFHGHTHQSIADKLNLPLGTVKTHLRRGLLRVRDGLQAARAGSGSGSEAAS